MTQLTSAIPLETIKDAERIADIWERPVYVGRRRETMNTARGEQFLIRRSPESASELGVYLVVLPSN